MKLAKLRYSSPKVAEKDIDEERVTQLLLLGRDHEEWN